MIEILNRTLDERLKRSLYPKVQVHVPMPFFRELYREMKLKIGNVVEFIQEGDKHYSFGYTYHGTSWHVYTTIESRNFDGEDILEEINNFIKILNI